MTYNTQALILKFLFSVHSTDEVAETQLTLTSVSEIDAVAALSHWNTTDLDDLMSLYYTLAAAGNWRWADYSHLTGAKMAAVDHANHYLAEPLVKATTETYVGSFAHVPAQASTVLSLRSGQHLGVANYGRMYLPHTSWTLGTTSAYATSATTDSAAAVGVTFIEAVNAISHAKTIPTLVSIRSKKGTGSTKTVLDVAIGNVTDTQQRRRRQLPESYSHGAITLP